MDAQEREWTAWETHRPTVAGLYWWRLPPAQYGGETLQPEWTCKVSLYGMGYAEKELWPSFSHWDGYHRSIPAGLEWSPAEDNEKVAHAIPYHGLKTCPFCGGVVALIGDNSLRGGGARLYSVPFKPWRFGVSCRCGRAGSGWFETVRGATSRWNERACTNPGPLPDAPHTPEWLADALIEAEKRGAERMRERAARLMIELGHVSESGETLAIEIRALPLTEDTPDADA